MMQTYEAPDIKFEELTFFEKIAYECWYGDNFYLDKNKDGDSDCDEKLVIRPIKYHGGCMPPLDLLLSIHYQIFPLKPLSFAAWCKGSGILDLSTVNSTKIKDIHFGS